MGIAAWGCTCRDHNRCPEAGGADHPVFLGTVLSVAEVPQVGEPVWDNQRRARMRVTESFGGVDVQREVDVFTGRNSADCGIRFVPGETYLVDARKDRGGVLRTNICAHTRELRSAGAEVEVLRRLRRGERLPALTGRMRLWERGAGGSLRGVNIRPVARSRIRVVTGARSFAAQADGDGVFVFSALPAGKYRFDVEAPAGMRVADYLDSDRPRGGFELQAGSCALEHVDVFPSGSIAGRVVDGEGRAVRDEHVFILPAGGGEVARLERLYGRAVDGVGGFSFVNLPDGEYVLMVRVVGSLWPEFFVRKTYYPGVGERERARVIRVRGGAAVMGVEIVVR